MIQVEFKLFDKDGNPVRVVLEGGYREAYGIRQYHSGRTTEVLHCGCWTPVCHVPRPGAPPPPPPPSDP